MLPIANDNIYQCYLLGFQINHVCAFILVLHAAALKIQ